MKAVRNIALALGAAGVLAGATLAVADEAKPGSRHQERHAARADKEGEHRHGMQAMQKRHAGMQERHENMRERHGGHGSADGEREPEARHKHDHS